MTPLVAVASGCTALGSRFRGFGLYEIDLGGKSGMRETEASYGVGREVAGWILDCVNACENGVSERIGSLGRVQAAGEQVLNRRH